MANNAHTENQSDHQPFDVSDPLRECAKGAAGYKVVKPPKGNEDARLPWPPIKEYLDLFYKQGMKTKEIAKLYGCEPITLRQWRAKLNVPLPVVTMRERFFKKVRKAPNGCWEWTGARMARGYGVFSCRLPNHHRSAKAHRISWEIANSASLLPGTYVLHSCDNPCCVNPDHLSIGTAKENTAQCIERGRHNPARGERNNNSRLTESQVKEARQRCANGEIPYRIAKEYGVSGDSLYKAVIGVTWAWVK